MPINFPDSLQANSTTFFLVDEGQLRGTARSITTFSNGALATTFPNNARVKVGSLAIATDTNQVYVCINVTNYNLTTGWTSVGISYTAGQLMSLSGNAIAFVGGSITGGNIVVDTTAGNQFTFRGADSTNPTLTLEGKSSSGWAKLYFNPHTTLDSYIDTHHGKLYFQTAGVGTSYYDSSQWYFSLPIISASTLSSSGSALQINPTYASSSNGILIGGSSANATTRPLSITTTLTGATSNALSVTSSVTSASALGRVVSFSPTLVASANSDVLQTLYLNPTFTLGAFTGVSRYSIYSNNGQTYYNAGSITETSQIAHYFTWSGNTGAGIVTTGFVIQGTTASSSSADVLFDVKNATTSQFKIEYSSGITFGTTSITFPNNASLITSGSASTLIISLGNNRMLNASSSGGANAGTTFKNFSHTHTGISGSPNSGNYTTLLLQDTYTFTGTTGSPVARSLYINPTYTASAGSTYRAIEVTRGDIAFNTTSGKVFMGGTSAVSSTTNASLIISKQSDQAQVNFNPLNSPIAGAVLGDIWFDSSSYNLWMTQKDYANNTTNFKFLTYFNSSFTGQPITPSASNGISGALGNDVVLLEPDLWIQINNEGTAYFLPCYTNP
jgi:hypothetical protein